MDANIPFELSQPSYHVSNAEFLAAICPDLPEGSYQWVTSFRGDPNETGGNCWGGTPIMPVQTEGSYRYFLHEDPGSNAYFCISHFSNDGDGRPSRAKLCYRGTHTIVFDDLGNPNDPDAPGAKVPWEKLRGRLTPSFIIETSPGSYQVGYILLTPIKDRAIVEATLKALVYQALGMDEDPGMLNVTRYVRLPNGINSKGKYLFVTDRIYSEPGADGVPVPLGVPSRLVHWAPHLRYELFELTADYGLDLSQYLSEDTGAGSRHAAQIDIIEDDIWYPIIEATGLLTGRPDYRRNEGKQELWLDMMCPWIHEHTDQADSGTGYCVTMQSFVCHHGHCKDRNFVTLRNLLMAGRISGAEHAQFYPELQARARKVYAAERLGTDAEMWAVQQAWNAKVEAHLAEVIPEFVAPQAKTYADLATMVTALREGDTSEEGRKQLQELIDEAARANLSGVDLSTLIASLVDRTTLTKSAAEKVVKEAGKRQEHEERAVLLEAQRKEALENGKLAPPMITAWKEVNQDGAPLMTINNTKALVEDAQGKLRYNAMSMKEEFGGVFARYPYLQSPDHLTAQMESWALINGINPGNRMYSTLRAISAQDTYHPFDEYLRWMEANRPWDGMDRLGGPFGLFSTVLVAPGVEDLRDAILRHWFYSIIAAARYLYRGRTGTQPRGVLVFAGQQYSGKTTWLGRLFQGLFPGSHRCFLAGTHYNGSADSKLELLGQLVTELGELDATTRLDAAQLKAFLSSGTDRVRRPYGRAHEDMDRRTVFAGTVNVDFIKDDSGNTRFWTIPTRGFDLDRQRTEIDMAQVWAQVNYECMVAWNEFEMQGGAFAPWLLRPEMMPMIERVNEEHRALSDAEEILLDLFDWDYPEWRKSVTTDERMKINPMSLTEVKLACGSGKSLIRGNWVSTLKRLTGAPRARRTTARGSYTPAVGVTVQIPEDKPRMGRYWPMPPMRTAHGSQSIIVTSESTDAFDDVTPSGMPKPDKKPTKH